MKYWGGVCGLSLILICIVFTSQSAFADETFGRVIIKKSSLHPKMSKVVFDHWVHRARFTCRVCHVDIGFAMAEGDTPIRASDNQKGYYCGACHNGKRISFDAPVFSACVPSADTASCNRCHSFGEAVVRRYDFSRFVENMPKASLGNGIDWEKAESLGLINPRDSVMGVPVVKRTMPTRKDFTLDSKASWIGDTLFSHSKHSKWNGCELCHPDIFLGVSKGATKYNMMQIYSGEYCGVCHLKVAFPLQDCSRCHVKPVKE